MSWSRFELLLKAAESPLTSDLEQANMKMFRALSKRGCCRGGNFMGDTAKKLCFIVGPIGAPRSEERQHADWLLRGIIEPVMANRWPEFEVKRPDHDPRPGLIDIQMIKDLLEAELVIADLSFLNPNAFYEIGIRHMAQKPIVHMQRMKDVLPFDVSGFRAVRFSWDDYEDYLAAKRDLQQAVEAVLDPNYVVENPVTRARGVVAISEHATPAMQLLWSEVDALKERVSTLQFRQELDDSTHLFNADSNEQLLDLFRKAEGNKLVKAMRASPGRFTLTPVDHDPFESDNKPLPPMAGLIPDGGLR